jgi:hypothetical protein
MESFRVPESHSRRDTMEADQGSYSANTQRVIVRWIERHDWIAAAAFAAITVVQVVRLIVWLTSR